MDGVKVYGLCLERLKHQIETAKKRISTNHNIIILECYNTDNIEDIIDILELYDIDEKTQECLDIKLEDLAYSASLLVQESIAFDYNDDGYLGLYWINW